MTPQQGNLLFKNKEILLSEIHEFLNNKITEKICIFRVSKNSLEWAAALHSDSLLFQGSCTGTHKSINKEVAAQSSMFPSLISFCMNVCHVRPGIGSIRKTPAKKNVQGVKADIRVSKTKCATFSCKKIIKF